jgi:hypothetical protein
VTEYLMIKAVIRERVKTHLGADPLQDLQTLTLLG